MLTHAFPYDAFAFGSFPIKERKAVQDPRSELVSSLRDAYLWIEALIEDAIGTPDYYLQGSPLTSSNVCRRYIPDALAEAERAAESLEGEDKVEAKRLLRIAQFRYENAELYLAKWAPYRSTLQDPRDRLLIELVQPMMNMRMRALDTTGQANWPKDA